MFKLKNGQKLILASGSPRRRELLSGSGLSFEVNVSGVEEAALAGEGPDHMVKRLALLKAEDIAIKSPESWVVGADTDVFLDGQVFGKPTDAKDAVSKLRLLQGRTHTVWGGIALVNLSRGIKHVEAHASEVTMAALDDQQIINYVATSEPLDKAGAYAIQGVGAALVCSVSGSYTNVVGLNLAALISVLKKFGAIE